MKEKSYGGLLVVLFVCILAFSFGAVFGIFHVGEELSYTILPTSLTQSSDILEVIDEKSFEPENITVKYQTQTTVKQVSKNTTNTTNTTNYNNSEKYPSNRNSSNNTE